jgi:spermidine dehydrogenase
MAPCGLSSSSFTRARNADILGDRPYGRIAFANTDLAGASDHRNSIREADRAVKQLL